MAASLLKQMLHKLSRSYKFSRSSNILISRYFSNSSSGDDVTNQQSKDASIEQSTPTEDALHKFDKLVEKVKSQQTISSPLGDENKQETTSESFATMLRKSKFVALGEDQDKRVVGKIIEVMEDDLYIDFGGKFHCVCPRPRKNGEQYQRGTQVILSLKTQEMSSAFLGSDVHITLLEADAVLLGLKSTPKRINRL